MAKPFAPSKTLVIEGFFTKGYVDRFLSLLSEKYSVKIVKDKGSYVVGHWTIIANRSEFDIVAYTSDKIIFRTSSKTDISLFEEISSDVEKIAKQATEPVTAQRPITSQRAKTILNYISTLDPEKELDRIIMVILADTAVEIMLTEIMMALKIEGPPLSEGIPEKIKRIEDKKQVVYRKDDLQNIREFRNGIVHRGQIPDANQAFKCREIASDFIEHC